MARWLARAALALLVLLALLIAAAIWLTEPLLRAGLRVAGAETVRFDAVSLGLERAEVTGLRLGSRPSQMLGRLVLEWRLRDLLAGRVRTVSVEGLRIRGRLGRDGIEPAGMATGSGDGALALPPVPHPERLVVRDARLDLSTPLGVLYAELDLKGALDDDGRMRLRTSDLKLRMDEPADALDPLQAIMPAPWRLGAGTAEAPLELTVERPGEEIEITLEGPLTLANGGAMLRMTTRTTLAFSRELELRAVRPQALMVEGRDLRWRGMALRDLRLEAAAEGDLEDLSGRARLALAGAGSPVPGLSLSGLALDQGFTLRRTGGALVLDLEPGGRLEAARVIADGLIESEAPRLELAPAEEPLLVVESEDGRITGWRQALTLRAEAASLELIGPAPLPLEAATAVLRLDLGGDDGGLEQGRIALTDGRVVLPQQEIALEGIRTGLAFDPGLTTAEVAPLAIATIRATTKPPAFSPLALEAKLRPGPGRLAFDGRLSDRSESFVLSFAGSHDLARAAGEASLDLGPIDFTLQGLQPDVILPALGRNLRQVAGRLQADGRLTWGEGGLESGLALLLEDIDAIAGPARIERLNGVVDFDRLWPPSTPPDQRLAAALVEIGLPLTRGLAAFRLEPGGRLAVEELGFDWGGGVLRAEPFSLGSRDADISFVLRAEGLGLAQILEQVRLDGLSGEGRIGGRLPVSIEGSEATIKGGDLEGLGPGWLRYRPATTPGAFEAGGEGMDLLLQALENFRYEELRITLDGRTDSEMDIGLHIKGANPSLYDGHPIEFNLNLEGELGNILRSGLRSYRLPERIRERMRDVERR